MTTILYILGVLVVEGLWTAVMWWFSTLGVTGQIVAAWGLICAVASLCILLFVLLAPSELVKKILVDE